MFVITVAQSAARPWDGQRILRFLTGLALLALAVTLRLPAPAAPAAGPDTVAPAVVTAAAEIAEADPEIAEAAHTVSERAVGQVLAPATVTFTTRIADGRIPSGEIPGATGSRAPPAA